MGSNIINGCPPCRRASLAIAQGKLFKEETNSTEKRTMPSPEIANSGISEGLLAVKMQKIFIHKYYVYTTCNT